MGSYVAYHVHTDYSLLDSCTSYTEYVDEAVRQGQTAIAFSEHGKPLNWISKYKYCKEKGIKYIHAVEIYITEQLEPKTRDNFHTILIAKNKAGVKELNKVVSMSCNPEHFYYTNRISIDEFLSLSKNIITTSACLASPLNKLPADHPKYEQMVKRYDYLEIQPHNHPEQIAFNVHLAELAEKYHKPLIAGTDAHSLNEYKAECRKILLKRKHKSYGDEDLFDLTYKTYADLVENFRQQNAIPESLWMQAIENTNVMAASVEEFDINTDNKYPVLYGSPDNDVEAFERLVENKFQEKIANGIISEDQIDNFKSAIKEEMRVFKKIGMAGFMLSQSELNGWCKENKIPLGFARGSVGGSRVAYVTDIIDLNPETWHTVFSRFCNEDRVEVGDIDTDCREEDRPKIFEYIINRFGTDKTARVASYGTIKEAGAIDDICGALRMYWNEDHGLKPDENGKDNPYNLTNTDRIKKDFLKDPEKTREENPKVFYYLDGLLNTKVSQSVHPAGMVISPVCLDEEYGVFDKDGVSCLMLDMEDAHSAGLVKYDFLVLNTVNIINDTCKNIGINYPRSHEINWNDEEVWSDMLKSPYGIFQFESDYAFQLLKQFKPKSIFDMSLVTASVRPSGTSYRDDLMAHKVHKNPSPMIDELLKDNNGFLVYQEDQIKFLQDICGFSGSEADTVRRAIGKKDEVAVKAALPKILEGYCSKSDRPREVAEKEAQEFLRILEDSASYSFGYNHSVAYCLLGYLCAYFRHYYPYEFITAYLNNPNNPDDITNGTKLAQEYGILVTTPRWGVSREHFVFDKDRQIIAKGIESIKYLNKKIGNELYALAHSENKFNRFIDILIALKNTSIDARQLDILLKIGFFSEFGNCRELLAITEAFYKFKSGDAKKINPEFVTEELLKIITNHATNLNKDGKELKLYTITDMYGLLCEIEDTIRAKSFPELPIKTMIQNSMEYLGYVDITTGKEEDRRKLIIEDYTELASKSTGNVWCARINTTSVGSGKKSRLTVRSKLLKQLPIKKGDIIYANNVFKNSSGYWELTSYNIIN